MSPGELAAVVFGLSAGAVTGLPLGGWLTNRLGSVFMMRASLLVYAGALAWIPHAPSVVLLALSLMGLGIGNAMLDVSMNTAAVHVERAHGRQIMAGFHALFSFGGLGGAVVGTAAASAGIPAVTHMAVAAVGLSCAGLVASFWALPDPGGRAEKKQRGPLDRRLVLLGLLAFCTLLCEGAANDWSAVYVQDTLGGSAGVAAAGFAVFSLTMTAGRFAADRLVASVGAVAFLRGAGALAGLGFGASLLWPTPASALLGFGALGLGLAGVVPTLFSSAVRGRDNPAAAISTVSTIGYLGFLAGPPIVGALATAAGLRLGMVTLVVLALVIVFGATAAVRTAAG
ncbi:MFS transporter [Saccharopolyspora taberi]|uniref:MFS transporter n=2 Tax=Saccharopolyspora taberi TaxID=60895 RepID=A0ABN3V0C0_9PSEU